MDFLSPSGVAVPAPVIVLKAVLTWSLIVV